MARFNPHDGSALSTPVSSSAVFIAAVCTVNVLVIAAAVVAAKMVRAKRAVAASSRRQSTDAEVCLLKDMAVTVTATPADTDGDPTSAPAEFRVTLLEELDDSMRGRMEDIDWGAVRAASRLARCQRLAPATTTTPTTTTSSAAIGAAPAANVTITVNEPDAEATAAIAVGGAPPAQHTPLPKLGGRHKHFENIRNAGSPGQPAANSKSDRWSPKNMFAGLAV